MREFFYWLARGISLNKEGALLADNTCVVLVGHIKQMRLRKRVICSKSPSLLSNQAKKAVDSFNWTRIGATPTRNLKQKSVKLYIPI
jgi:hypothetical protein